MAREKKPPDKSYRAIATSTDQKLIHVIAAEEEGDKESLPIIDWPNPIDFENE